MGLFVGIGIGALSWIVAIVVGTTLHSRFKEGVYFNGSKIPEEKKAEVKRRYLLTVLAIIGFGTYFGIFYNWDQVFAEDADAWRTRDNSLTAYVMMHEFVKERLHSPSSARFPPRTDPNVSVERDAEGHIYRIRGYVDSQNMFGTMVRTRFSGALEQMDNVMWELVYLNIGN